MIESTNSIIGDYYKNNFVKLLRHNIKRKGSSADLRGAKLHHDNARFHQTNDTKTFLPKEGVVIIRDPSYFPDLTPSDF